jgi:hypothetical protein
MQVHQQPRTPESPTYCGFVDCPAEIHSTKIQKHHSPLHWPATRPWQTKKHAYVLKYSDHLHYLLLSRPGLATSHFQHLSDSTVQPDFHCAHCLRQCNPNGTSPNTRRSLHPQPPETPDLLGLQRLIPVPWSCFTSLDLRHYHRPTFVSSTLVSAAKSSPDYDHRFFQHAI